MNWFYHIIESNIDALGFLCHADAASGLIPCFTCFSHIRCGSNPSLWSLQWEQVLWIRGIRGSFSKPRFTKGYICHDTMILYPREIYPHEAIRFFTYKSLEIPNQGVGSWSCLFCFISTKQTRPDIHSLWTNPDPPTGWPGWQKSCCCWEMVEIPLIFWARSIQQGNLFKVIWSIDSFLWSQSI